MQSSSPVSIGLLQGLAHITLEYMLLLLRSSYVASRKRSKALPVVNPSCVPQTKPTGQTYVLGHFRCVRVFRVKPHIAGHKPDARVGLGGGLRGAREAPSWASTQQRCNKRRLVFSLHAKRWVVCGIESIPLTFPFPPRQMFFRQFSRLEPLQNPNHLTNTPTHQHSPSHPQALACAYHLAHLQGHRCA